MLHVIPASTSKRWNDDRLMLHVIPASTSKRWNASLVYWLP
jgi:hypothetical protein